MFYRQKILLALIEVRGGTVQKTDLEKLLFLFCQQSGDNHYDFFPYKFGAFSLTSYFDKRKLVEQGYLEDNDDFELPATGSRLSQLKSKDQLAMRAFAEDMRGLHGERLIRKTYLEYPCYVSRSTILERTLSPEEQKSVQRTWNKDTTSTLFTIGYEGRTIDAYLRTLIFNNVKVLIDVRRNPISRKQGFSKNRMKRYLNNAGINYIHLPQLGIASHLRKNLDNSSSYATLFRQYADEILPSQSDALTAIRQTIQRCGRIALTCFEADPNMCHRHKVTEALEADVDFGYPVVHL